MKKDDWIKDIQRRMTDHQEPVKDDLWAGIEQALDQQKVVGKPAVVMRWRRYVAAAAIVLALMGGAGYVLFNHQEQMGKRWHGRKPNSNRPVCRPAPNRLSQSCLPNKHTSRWYRVLKRRCRPCDKAQIVINR